MGEAAPMEYRNTGGELSLGDYTGSLNDKSNSWAEQEEYAIESYISGYWWREASLGNEKVTWNTGEPIYKTRLKKIERDNAQGNEGNTIRQNSNEPNYIQNNEFSVTDKSYFRFSNLSYADKVEFLDKQGNLIFNVIGKEGNNQVYPNQQGTYFKFGATVKMQDIYEANNGVKFLEIQIRVTGNPEHETKWSYQYFNALETRWFEKYNSVRFMYGN